MNHRSLALLLIVCFCLTTGGCVSSYVRRRAERKLSRELHNFLGPAERYRVRIARTSGARLVKGNVERLVITGENVEMPDSIAVRRLHVALDGLKLVRGDIDLLAAREGRIRLDLDEAAVNRYLADNHPRHEATVDLESGHIHASIRYPPEPGGARISATGRLLIEEGVRVIFRADKVSFSLLQAPGFGERFVEQRVNPILDLSKMRFPTRLTDLTVFDDALRISGGINQPQVFLD